MVSSDGSGIHKHVYTLQILVQALFEPANIAALSHQLDIPQSLMFMGCPGEKFKHHIALLGGTRIISL